MDWLLEHWLEVTLVWLGLILFIVRWNHVIQRKPPTNFTRQMYEPSVGKGYDSTKLRKALNESDELPQG